ncbi:FG-GAP-like repeat-containing protein [Microlunatus spumicola]|uniref:FG-GAP-like repeat-containing protein n=1 Tax=Microlunatus spumicola TaxID=81499 RepID=A0ABP6WJI2_9ACTN
MPGRPFPLVACLLLTSPLLLMSSAPAAVAATSTANPYDFDGDGYPDLVVGAPFLRVGTLDAGGVVVLPGSASSLKKQAQVISAATAGVIGDPANNAQLGHAVTSADFDGDGFADLAVGVPVDSRPLYAAGAVTVLYGSPEGLRGKRSLELLQPGGPQGDATFGAALASGDLDGDGRADLAVGAPGVSAGALGSGSVFVFSGSRGGLSADRAAALPGRRSSPGPGADEDERFGASLAVGDVDADGRPDLVVGAPGYAIEGGGGLPGSVSACYGAPAGPTGCTQLDRRPQLAGLASVAVGDVTGSARPEVVVAVPSADLEGSRGGTVDLLTLSGPRAATTVTRVALTQRSKGVPGSDKAGDRFGSSVALGDLDADGHADLVIGADGEKVGGHVGAGRVTVVHGGARGYRTSGNRVYDQNTKGVTGTAEKHDSFGEVALLDVDADGHLDLAVGAPGENDAAGGVTFLRGSGSGFSAKRSQAFTLKDLGYASPKGAGLGEALGR